MFHFFKDAKLPVLIFTGRLTKIKRLDLLIKAVTFLNRKEPRVNALLVGDGTEKENLMNINVENEYNSDTRALTVKATVVPLQNFPSTEKLHISVMVLENGIIDAQEDPTHIIEDYEHNHVLRTMLTDFKGDPINEDLSENEVVEFIYNFTIPIAEEGKIWWNPENMDIVVFVNAVNGERKDVIQAAEAHVIK